MGTKVSELYFELVRENPLREIRTVAEHKRAIAMLGSLYERKLDRSGKDYKQVLIRLIDDYERNRYPHEKVSPVEMLRFLLEVNRMSQKELAEQAGIDKTLISAVLAGRRKLSLPAVGKLARRFKVSPALFIDAG